MKPEIAIVQPAPVDVDAAAEHIIVALAGEKDATRTAERHEQLGAAARETAKVRRLEVGRWLNKVRPTWPASGPKAKGWSEFLARVKLDDSTAVRYMEAARTSSVHGEPTRPSSPQDSAHERPVSRISGGDVKPDAAAQPALVPGLPSMTEEQLLEALAQLDPVARKRIRRALRPANVHGGSGEDERGKYCTPKKYAEAAGPWDLDPFSNRHSHIVSHHRCMLEDGGDGLVAGVAGTYRTADGRERIANADTRVWIQPDYRIVLEVIAHYGHTRFCALLRFAPDTKWFALMWPLVAAIAIPRERLPFETPDGVIVEGADEGEAAGAPFPHVFFYSNERDITPAIRELCIVLRVENGGVSPDPPA